MPKQSYKLMNPMIEGSFSNTYDANTPLKAAEKMWTSFSKHIMGYVPRFIFTMKNESNDSLHHFEVNENGTNGNYSISPINVNTDVKVFNNFAKNVVSFENGKDYTGGKRKRYEDDSSSSSSSPYYVRRQSPIVAFHYFPRIYDDIILAPDVTTLNPTLETVAVPIFTPIFREPLLPFVVMW